MYESPVNFVLQDVQSQITQDAERTIINVIGKCGVTVDKGEIIKALRYDRNQYTKGYKDGVNNTLDKLREKIMDTGGYEQEVNGKTEFLKGIDYCLSVIDKCREAENEVMWHG